MSSSIVPAPAKREVTWKRIFVTAAGFGAGFAIILLLAIVGWKWYSSRPQLPKAWNTGQLRAEFRNVVTSKDDHFQFYYIVENRGDIDYRLNSTAGVTLAVRAGTHLAMCGDCLTLPVLPLFIPARQKMLLPIGLNYSVPLELKKQISSAPDADEDKLVAAYVNKKFTHLDGFVLYDENNRLQIDFPKGW